MRGDADPVLYAVGDTHGYIGLLSLLLKKIRHYHAEIYPTREAWLVTIGDYVDRGPSSYDVVTLLIQPQIEGFARKIHLRGNHEQLMIDAFRAGRGGAQAHWLRNGGDTTVASYEKSGASGQEIEVHIAWMESLPTYFQYGDWMFVHAGIDPRIVDPAKTKDETLLWIRRRFLWSRKTYPWRVVHGHTPEKRRPVFKKNRIGIDTGPYIYGVLSAIVIDIQAHDEPVVVQARS